MRRTGALCAALAGVASLGVTPPPQRIMSLNLCTDLLLLQLAPRARITSVTHLAPAAAASVLPGGAAGIPVNHGTAEEIVRDRPDLILAASFSAATAQRLARRTGVRVVNIPAATDFAAIRATTRQVATLVGNRSRGEALVRSMDRQLAMMRAAPPRRRPRVVAWTGGGSALGPGTLADAIIRAAGAVNVGTPAFDLERLVALRPDAILVGRSLRQGPSLRTVENGHFLAARLAAGRTIRHADAAFDCGLPQSADAAVTLRRALDRLPARP